MAAAAYRHTQKATLLRVLLGDAAVLLAALCIVLQSLVTGVAAAVIVLALWVFSSLTVEIDGGELRWHFGPGLWIYSRALAEIKNAEPVRNSSWYGWGIRYTPHGWLYNVSGLEAVEIALDGGKRLRVGTDEPAALAKAITQATATR